MCLAQGHNAVKPVRLEPAALWSRVKHSTTEPLRSLCEAFNVTLMAKLLTFSRQKYDYKIILMSYDK